MLSVRMGVKIADCSGTREAHIPIRRLTIESHATGLLLLTCQRRHSIATASGKGKRKGANDVTKWTICTSLACAALVPSSPPLALQL